MSGSYAEETVRDITQTLKGSRHAPGQVIDCQETSLPGAGDLERAGVDCLIVFTGDGTLSRYLGNLEGDGWRGTVLPLPGGTKNLLCTDIFGESDALDIARLLARGRLSEGSRGCIRCGKHTALAEILLGPDARSAEVRESLRQNDFADALKTSAEIASEAANGPLIRIVEPPIDREQGYPGILFTPVDETLWARGYHLESVEDWVKQTVAIAKRDFRDGPHDDLGTMRRARCCIEDNGTIDAMIDGELECLSGEVEVVFDHFALPFLMPGTSGDCG